MIFILVTAIQSAFEIDSIGSRSTTPGSEVGSSERTFSSNELDALILHNYSQPNRFATITEESLPSVSSKEKERAFARTKIEQKMDIKILEEMAFLQNLIIDEINDLKDEMA